MSSEWKSGRLGEFIELKRGYDLPQAKREKGSIPLISSSGHSDYHSEAKVSGPGVVTGRYGTIGQVFYVEQDFWPLNTTLYVKDFKGNDPKFIHYFLKTIDFLAYSDKAAVPGVNRNHLHEALVNVPRVNLQVEIAAFLGALDDRIALLRETNATLEAIAQALFKSWFVDFDPVHANAGTQAPSLPAEIQALFPSRLVESQQGLIPEGWAYVNLGELVCNQSTTFKFDGVENVVFVNTGDVSEGVFLHQNYVPVSGLPGQAKKAIKRDDILFSEIRPKNKRFAYVNVEPKDYVVSTKFMVLRAISDISPRYIYQILKQDPTIDFFNVIAESRSGTFPQITFDSIKNFQVLRPSKVCVDKFIDTLQPIIEQIDLNAERQKEFSALRDTLLPRLISGQLRLPEAEAVLAEVG
jgi:type I restriction enzyme S subunit